MSEIPRLTSDFIKYLLHKAIEDIPEEVLKEIDSETSELAPINKREALDIFIKDKLGNFVFLGTGAKVLCAIPKNEHHIDYLKSVQCKNHACQAYFCKKPYHQISSCPLCGTPLP